MKKLSFLLISCFTALLAMAQIKSPVKHLPRIAIAGLGIESSTFSPARTEEVAFHAKYGNDIFSIYPFWAPDSSVRKAAALLLEKAHVATIPGAVFGSQGEGHVRFSYSISMTTIEQGLEGLRQLA